MGDYKGSPQLLAKERMIWYWRGERDGHDLPWTAKVDGEGRILPLQPVFTDANAFILDNRPIRLAKT
jgi:hypothetical protein